MSNFSNLNWDSPLDALYKGKKVPKSLESLADANIKTLRDLIWTLPHKYYPLVQNPTTLQCNDGDVVRLQGVFKRITVRPIFKKRFRLFQVRGFIQTQNDIFPLIWFNAYPNTKEKILDSFQEQIEVHIEGPVKKTGPFIQVVSPKFVKEMEREDKASLVYPTINKVKGSFIGKLIKKIPHELLDRIPELPGELSLKESFVAIHQFEASEGGEEFLRRLKFQEFLEDQFKIFLRKQKNLLTKITPLKFSKESIQDALKLLPYKLTKDQDTAFDNILHDLQSESPMQRLVQGDVGCGKTSLAILGIALLDSLNLQSAFMAPTENLAFQHLKSIEKIFPRDKIAFLSSSVKGKERTKLLEDIALGVRTIIIGTHSLFQDKVQYKDLNLIIIDEQHKFGVDQRVKLFNKANRSHCLLLSATPIPRTLSLTLYGDLEISLIKTMPANRKGFKTRIVEKANIEKYLSFLKTRLELGEQAYIVLPNIEKSEMRNTLSIDEVLTQYQKFFPNIKISALHGQLDSDLQKEVIQNFRDKKIQVLISTTVIEVGIHVANATVMSIYHPEYFGLSSLHQLRGRVGRDEKQGFCFLIISDGLGASQKERLVFFEKHSNGFEIAEEDLRSRGEGDLFGKTQAGALQVKRIASLVEDKEIFESVIEKKENYIKNSDIMKAQLDFMGLANNPYVLNII